MPGPQGQWEGAEGFKNGNPKRSLETIPIFNLDTTFNAESGTRVQRMFLNGLTGNLKISVGGTVLTPNGNVPVALPAGGLVMQIWPYQSKNGRKLYAREIFQDPTLEGTDNENHPLPVDCPFFWEGPFTEADGLLVEFTVDVAAWRGNQTGTLVAQATVEYNGNWWDVAAFIFALSNVQWMGAPEPITVGTSGGG